MTDNNDIAARFAALPDDMRANLDTIIAAAERDLKRKQADKDARLKQLEHGESLLPVNERIALHVLGNMAISGLLTISDMHEEHGNNFYYLFTRMSKSITEGLKATNSYDLKELLDSE